VNLDRGGKRKQRLFSGEFMRGGVMLAETQGDSVPPVLGDPCRSVIV
jgi:hypothetical protein